MGSGTYAEKKQRVSMMVERAIAESSADGTALASIQECEFPQGLSNTLPIFLFILSAEGLLLTGSLYYGLTGSWMLCYLFSAGTMITALAGLLFSRSLRRRRDGLIQIILEVVKELHREQQQLEQYLNEVDTRTAKFFHCVTTTKVTAHFLLGQIQGELKGINKAVLSALEEKNIGKLYESLELLKDEITVSNGLVVGSGETLSIPMPAVYSTVRELQELLEKGIKELEEEIESYRERVMVTP